nr:hypothetical protein [Candidatus Microthrix sp.]
MELAKAPHPELDVAGPAVSSNARRAAASAASTSAGVASAATPSCPPVAGFSTG